MKKTALIVGSSGLVCSYVVKYLLRSQRYHQVISLVRKPVDIQHKKLTQVVFDFDNPDPSVVKADDIFCCLGTTIKKAGSKQAFRKVDYEYPLQIARMGLTNGASRFAVVTAMGSAKESLFFYSRVKGELEADLEKLPYHGLYIFRPALLLGKRDEFRAGEKVATLFVKLLQPILPSSVKGIHASKVAGAMIHHVEKETPGVHYFDSGEMQRLEL
jgi:uncharacterized protein YbjT (DUF2867 family)